MKLLLRAFIDNLMVDYLKVVMLVIILKIGKPEIELENMLLIAIVPNVTKVKLKI